VHRSAFNAALIESTECSHSKLITLVHYAISCDCLFISACTCECEYDIYMTLICLGKIQPDCTLSVRHQTPLGCGHVFDWWKMSDV
jgi:hypothetical protein